MSGGDPFARIIELEVAAGRVSGLEAEIAKLEQELCEERDHSDNESGRAERAEARVRELERDNRLATVGLSEALEKLDAAEDLLGNLQVEANIQRERADDAEAEARAVAQDEAVLRGHLETATERAQALEAEAEALANQVSTLRADLAAERDNADAANQAAAKLREELEGKDAEVEDLFGALNPLCEAVEGGDSAAATRIAEAIRQAQAEGDATPPAEEGGPAA